MILSVQKPPILLLSSSSALELLKTAISKAGYTDKIVIGMDVAASEFYRDGKYDLDFKSPDDPSRYITPDQLADLYKGFVKNYPCECKGHIPSEGHTLLVGRVGGTSRWRTIVTLSVDREDCAST